MGLQNPAGDSAEDGIRSFIAMTRADFASLSVEDDEPCPRCGSSDKVRGPTNRWQCKQCNRTWNRKLNYERGTSDNT